MAGIKLQPSQVRLRHTVQIVGGAASSSTCAKVYCRCARQCVGSKIKRKMFTKTQVTVKDKEIKRGLRNPVAEHVHCTD